jgi:AraC-like DNA-binding protein
MGRLIPPGAEISREGDARYVPRHAHVGAYAALVLRGGYVEAGDSGRFRVSAGQVLVHDAFEAHQDHFHRGGADVLNLPLPSASDTPFGHVEDPDEIVRLAERDAAAAATLLVAKLQPTPDCADDWPDRLAADLRAGAVTRLGLWARQAGLRPQSLSRGFRLAYGVSPQRYRAEQRAAKAARDVRRSALALASIAAAAGFADQPHMNRMLRRLYALTPGALRERRDVQCVQDEPGASD